MRGAVLTLFTLGLACLASADKLMELEGHQTHLRKQLGHFGHVHPFIYLYKTYAASFVHPLQQKRDFDDYRNYLPAVDECITFLKAFQINQYQLRDIEKFVLLDACLGYLYESEYHDEDSENNQRVKDELPGLIGDEKLRALYEGTKVESFSEEAKDCIADLLTRSTLAKKQFPEQTCNDDWLKLFTQFARCHKSISEEAHVSDSYVVFILDLVKKRGHQCFLHEVGTINEALRLDYKKRRTHRLRSFIKNTSLAKQARERMWTPPMVRLLSGFQNTTIQINLREVHAIIRGIEQEDKKQTQRLLNNLAYLADHLIQPEKKSKDAINDPTGVDRYTHLVDDMCNFFRSADHNRPKDYNQILARMYTLLDFPEIFGISHEAFVESVLTHGRESAALYLCISSCFIMSYTQGALVELPYNHKKHYAVEFNHDLSTMIQRLNAGHY